MARDIKKEIKSDGSKMIGKNLSLKQGIFVVAIVFFFAWIFLNMGGDDGKPNTTTQPSPTTQEQQPISAERSERQKARDAEREKAREAERQKAKEAEQQKVLDKQIALDNLNNAANILSGSPLNLATKWYGEDDIRFVIQVNRSSWNSIIYDDRVGLLLAVGEASDLAGFLSMWVIDNRTREKLADYRLGRVDIKK